MFSPRDGRPPLPALRLGDVLLLLALFTALSVGLGLAQARFAAFMDSNLPEALSQGGLVPIIVLQSALTVLLVFVLIVWRRGLPWAALGFRRAERRWYRLAIAGGLACVPLVALSRLLFEPLLEESFVNPQLDVLGAGGFSLANLLILLVLVGVLAPVTEELLFRGLLYPLLRRWMPFFFAGLLSALCFAALHWIPPLVPAFTLMGLVLAAAREWSGSLWPPIIIHGLFNSLNLITFFAALGMGQAG